MAKTQQVGLLQSFKEYDELPLPAGIEQDDLNRIARGTNNAPRKLKAFSSILSSVQKSVNGRLSGLTSIADLKILNTYSADSVSRSISTKLSYTSLGAGKGAVKLNTNVNVNKLLKYPAMEVYSLLSAAVYNSVMGGLTKSQLDEIKGGELEEQDADFELLKVDEIDRQKTLESQKNVSLFLLREYLKDLFLQFFPEDFAGNDMLLNFVAEQVSTQMINELKPQEIARIPKLFFSFKSIESKAISNAKEILPSRLYALRTEKIAEDANVNDAKAYEVTTDYVDPKLASAQQQYLSLSACFAGKTNAVKSTLQSGMNNDNQELLAFCQKYADEFMRTNNIPESVPIRFGGSGCEYFDQEHFIQIDLNNKMFQGGNISELILSLSHELTHAAESYSNKQNGRINQYGGGLVGTMSEDISGCDVPEAENLLKRVQHTCYVVNPVERNARLGEMSGILFMKDLYADDTNMNTQVNESISRFASYQKMTIKTIKDIEGLISSYEAEFSALQIPKSSAAYKMISERIEYLKKSNLDVSREEAAIEEAEKILKNKTQSGKHLAGSQVELDNIGMEM